jgi:hypothetical protein
MTAALPHTLLDSALLLRAQEYTASLYDGAEINPSDWRYLKETKWGALITKALADADLAVEVRAENGTQVYMVTRRKAA